MDIFDSIENNNFEEVRKLVENGANIYKVRYFRTNSPNEFPEEVHNKYNLFFNQFLHGIEPELPLTHPIAFCESDEISSYLLDIYERDLGVLKGTNYKKALVAYPEDQSEELLNCCTFSIPSDEKFYEPVLLKKNNLEPPKLAFLCRKLKDKNDQSLKFIHKLEKNGCCDLNYKIPNEFTDDTILQRFIRAEKAELSKRIFTSSYLDQELKQMQFYDFCCKFKNLNGFEDICGEYQDYYAIPIGTIVEPEHTVENQKTKNKDLEKLTNALKEGNVEQIMKIYDKLEDKNIFANDEEMAVGCLERSVKFFNNEPEKIVEILKLLFAENYDTFISKNGNEILARILAENRNTKAVYTFLKFPSLKIKLEDIFFLVFDIVKDKDEFNELMSHIDVPDWNVKTIGPNSLFMNACEFMCENPEFLKSIIEKQPDCIHQRTLYNATCLHLVCFHKTNETAKLLVESGLDPQIRNFLNEKPVFSARFSYEVFKYLLQFESDEDLKERYTYMSCPLLYAVQDVNVIELVYKRNADLPSYCYYYDHFQHIKSGRLKFDEKHRGTIGHGILVDAIRYSKPENLLEVIKYFKDDIDFSALNGFGDTFSDLVMNGSLEKLQELLAIVKNEIYDKFLANLRQFDKYLTINIFEIFDDLSLEILQENFLKLINKVEVLEKCCQKYPNYFDFLEANPKILLDSLKNCTNPRTIEFLISKLNPEIFNKVNGDENILHVVCEKNNQWIIEEFLIFLSADQIEALSKQICDGKKPYDMLNDELKILFHNILQN